MTYRLSSLLLGGASLLALGAVGAVHAQTTGVGDQTQEVVVTGTRTSGLKASDSAAPVQVLDSGSLQRVAQPDLAQALAQNVPSFTAQAFGGDVANNSLSARLRGVSPNDALILIDGKRRHNSGNLAILGENYGSPYQGGAAPDLSFIPVDAIDHVEVLTDGAAAQYGTDAIAGVINIILKKNAQGGNITATGGHYIDEGGETGDIAANVGFQPLANSYFNISAENKFHGHSDRGAIDPRVNDNPSYASLPGYPYLNHIDGDARVHLSTVSFNAGVDLNNEWQLYSFGTYGHKNAASFENWRTPAKLPAVYPDGFQPTEVLQEDDEALTAGIRGKVLEFDADLSTTYGRDDSNLSIVHDANVSLYNDTGSTPNAFHTGEFISSQWTNNLDFNRDFDIGLAGPLNVAFGAEQRTETYQLKPGDAASRYKEGSNAFPGFALTDASNHSRDNEAAYIDLALSPITGLKLDAAGRYEHFDDFGDTTVGKITGRYDFNPMIALRGTVSTGFRAPTLAEEYYSATNVSPTSAFVQLAPNSPAAQLLGISKLKPETSDNYSVGLVAHPAPRLTVTVDAYEIDIDDRIVGSGILYGTGNPSGVDSAQVLAAIKANGNILDTSVAETGVNIFANGANTQTRGVEAVATYSSNFGDNGRVDWSLSADYNETKVLKILQTTAAVSPQSVYDQNAISQLTDESPKFRIVAGALWTLGKFSMNLRESIYGPSSNKLEGDDGLWYTSKIETKALTDIEVSYKVVDHVKLTFGANNVFNVYPDKLNSKLLATYRAADDNYAVLQYPAFSPFGIDGGYYYGKITFSF